MLIILRYINELLTPQMRRSRTPAGRRGEFPAKGFRQLQTRKIKQLRQKTAPSRHRFRFLAAR